MKIITEPKITLVSRPQFIEHPDYPIPADGDEATRLGASAAKICYDSYGVDGRPNEDNQRVIMSSKHGSVIEHLTYGLVISGVTRGFSLEMNRHRTLAVSQRSTRYTREGDGAYVLEPYLSAIFRKYFTDNEDGTISVNPPENDPTALLECQLVMEQIDAAAAAFESYEKQIGMLEQLNPLNLKGTDLRKFGRGKARNSLPHGLETRATYTGNLRTWRWIIEARSNKHAEPEIRVVAGKIYDVLSAEAPLYFEDFEVVSIYDDIRELVPRFSKV